MADLEDPRIPRSNRPEDDRDDGGRQDEPGQGASRQEPNSPERAARPRCLDPLLLQSQARSLRRRSSGSIRGAETFEAPMWKKLLTLAVLLMVLGSVMYLLTFPQSRRQLAAQIGGAVGQVRGLGEERILRLPPPVRDEIAREDSDMPTVVFRSGSSQAEEAGEAERKILFLNTFPEDGQQTQEAVEEAAPPAKTEGAQGAYDLLLQQSEAARKVVEGEAEGWTFQEWKPVQNNPPRFYISLLAADAEGNVQQLIWEVDTEQGSAVARSQLARELARRLEN